jgi:transcriptional regulator of acetoin/glycerol metabolism
MSEAARTIGVHRSNLYRKMRQLEMSEVGGEQ